MLKVHFLILFIIFQFCVTAQQVYGQTAIQGRVLGADGSTIPKTAISIRPENPRDVFSSYYEDILPGEDGSYQFLVREPGMYRITFRGVFHHSFSIPVLIYDQPSMQMDILLLPMYYNDGAYFENEEYMKWIRIYGNFNNYSFDDGRSFSLNDDGSISAFIPVTSDTLRYQVRGLTYGRGSTPLPQADGYHYSEEHGFESVLYKDLPKDSLKIRYTPDRATPYKRYLPADTNPQSIILSGFISFENPQDRYWIEPLVLIRSYSAVHVLDRKYSSGIPVEIQREIQKKYVGGMFDKELTETEKKILSDLTNTSLHPQQHALLTLAYAGVLSWMNRQKIYWQYLGREDTMEIEYDEETIMSIPDKVSPVHPAWSMHQGITDALLIASNSHPKFESYFLEIVKHHPDEKAVRSAALPLIRFSGLDYTSVEAMPVYHSIVERYGEGELARDAYQLFNGIHSEYRNKDNK